MTIRRFITMIMALLTLGGLVTPAHAKEIAVTTRTTYAFMNCNWQDYTKGLTVNGVDLTWAKDTSTGRKYIRAQRLATLMKEQGRSSLYGLTECDTQMLTDLAKLLGSEWKVLAGDNIVHNRGGWIYDSRKWYPGNLSVTNLPGDPNGGYTGRRLLQVGFFRKVTGTDPMLSLALSHYSSGNPQARDLQATATLNKIGCANRLLVADSNASSAPQPGEDVYKATGPRWEMAQRKWSDPFAHQAGFHDYGRRADKLPVDFMSVSPCAQESGKIKMYNLRTISTLESYSSDHDMLVTGVEF